MHDRPRMTLAALNEADPASFAAMLDGVFEHAPWVAERAAGARPFATVAGLHEAMMAVVRAAPDAEQLALLNGHPELAGDKPIGGLTADSAAEQAKLAMAGTAGGDVLADLNRDYRARFGFPYIVCVARHTAANVLRDITRRLGGTVETEFAAALAEVARITAMRIVQRVDGPGPPKVQGSLSVHVLDMARGCPGVGIPITLFQEGRDVAAGVTDEDGRLGAGLLPEGPLRQGHYEMVFAVGGYFAARGQASLYDTVPIRFVIAEAEQHYHIPLLAAANGYTTYRGS